MTRVAATPPLQRGNAAYRERQRLAAIQRVKTFDAWVRARRPMTEIPPIPSRNDYRLARAAEEAST